MGTTLDTYRIALANFAAELMIETDSEKLSMMSVRQLKKLLLENKEKFSANEYYMKAGISAGLVINRAMKDRNVQMGEVYDGIAKFYEFLKVNDIKCSD